MPRRAPGLAPLRLQGGIEAGQQALRGSLFVAGGAIDLAGEEEACDGLGFQRGLEVARVVVVVFDGVAGAQDVRVFHAGDGAHDGQLHIEGQRGRDAIGVDLVRRQAFGFEEDLVAGLVGEAGDLVFDGRAVAWPHPLDDAGIHRRAVEAAANDVVRAFGGVGDPARPLFGMQRPAAHEGKHRCGVVARLDLGLAVIDAAAVDARRGARLESAHGQIQFAQARGERHRGRIAHAAGLVVFQSHVDEAGEESPRRQHHRPALEHDAELGSHPGDAVAVEQQVVNRLLKQREVRLVFQPSSDGGLVQHTVGLRAGGAHRRPLGRIERAELDARLVGGDRHRPAQRIHLLHQMALADATDGRIARHRTEGFDVVRQQQRPRARAGTGERGFGAGMAATDDNHIEGFGEFHGARILPVAGRFT